MNIKQCLISKAYNLNDLLDNNTLLMSVPISKNAILNAILEVKNDWYKSPIIWIDNVAYKIVLINKSNKCINLYQICVRFNYINNDHKYIPINKRLVKIIL